MSHITTCTSCGRCYEECSEEDANSPTRRCNHCWLGIRVGSRRASAELDDRATAEQPRRPIPGSRLHAFKGCGEEEEGGRPAADQAGRAPAHRSALNPAGAWPFDRLDPQTDQQALREWLRTVPEAPY